MALTLYQAIWIDLWHSGHYIMICKLYKSKTEAPNSHQPQQVASNYQQRYRIDLVDRGFNFSQAVVFANPEEELIVAESELCIDYEVIIPLDMYILARESLLQNAENVTWYSS